MMPARLINYLNDELWAIQPSTLDTWCDVLQAKVKDGKVLIKDFVPEAKTKSESERPFELSGPVAVIPVVGELLKRNTFFSSGMTYASIKRRIQSALDAPQVRGILLSIDSPGGAVSGCEELGDFIRASREQKPIHAFIDGTACSAAYWLASQCKEIAGPRGAVTGSIGVLAVHVDYSALDKERGIKVTYLHSGKYKAAGNPHSPLSDDDRDYLQSRLNQHYSQFVEAVSLGRGLEPGVVRDTQAKVLLANEAQSLGLIDQVMGFDQYLTRFKESLKMTLEELKAQHPGLVTQIQAQAAEGMVSLAEAADAEDLAVSEERQRILDLHACVFGPEAGQRFAQVVKAGVSKEQVEALGGILGGPAQEPGEKTKCQEMLDAITRAGAEPLSPATGQASAQNADPENWPDLVKAHAAEHGCSRALAIKAIEDLHPGLRDKYLDGVQGKGAWAMHSTENGKVSFEAGAAVNGYRLVRLSSGKVAHNTATDSHEPIGVTSYSQSSGEMVMVRLLTDPGIFVIEASGAIASGTPVFAADDGKIQALPAEAGDYRRIGTALDASSGAGDLIRVLPYETHSKTTVA